MKPTQLKTSFGLLLAVISAALLAGCDGGNNNSGNAGAGATTEPGTLVVGFSQIGA